MSITFVFLYILLTTGSFPYNIDEQTSKKHANITDIQKKIEQLKCQYIVCEEFYNAKVEEIETLNIELAKINEKMWILLQSQNNGSAATHFNTSYTRNTIVIHQYDELDSMRKTLIRQKGGHTTARNKRKSDLEKTKHDLMQEESKLVEIMNTKW